MQLNILVLSYVASAAVSGAVALAAWRRRSMVAARELALLMVAAAWWLVANAFEAASLDLSAKTAWSVIAYPGIVSVPVLYLAFVLGWTRQGAWLTRGRIGLLLVVPVVSVAMAATNPLHHLLWASVTLIDAWGVTAVYAHGPWFWVEVAYAYTLVAAALLALVVAMSRYPALYSKRILLILVASFAPIVAGLLYAAGLDQTLHADLSSISFAIAGLIGAWAILRSRALELAPVAWATLVDTLADAVVVLDAERRIAAVNPAATRLLGTGRDAIGRRVDDALHHFPELVSVCRDVDGSEIEIQVHPEQGDGSAESTTPEPLPDRWFSVRVTAIDERGRDVGYLVVLRDVTERRLAVERVRQLSLTDDLTGLLNRRGFMMLAEQQLWTSMRTRNRLWLLYADVDGLKDINDRLGHGVGDRAIREIADLLRGAMVRKADIVGRLGGDEFAVLATEITRTESNLIVDRLEGAVARANERPDRECALSLSMGTAVFDPDQPQTLDELIQEADGLMYREKRSRRMPVAAAH